MHCNDKKTIHSDLPRLEYEIHSTHNAANLIIGRKSNIYMCMNYKDVANFL